MRSSRSRKTLQNGKFDILLVFMFDRLGRKEDGTPFVVEWFVNNGIEVWSAEEGQQRFDTHVDKLMNYIDIWQASGESLENLYPHQNSPRPNRPRGTVSGWQVRPTDTA